MKSLQQFSLKSLNSFNFDVTAPTIYFPASLADLQELARCLPECFYILGEGSNTLFVDDLSPCIIHPCFDGIKVEEDDNNYYISAGCRENWHNLVTFCNKHGYWGLENLALIPGSVGAAPVQNIGAYGVELADVVDSVHWYSFEQQHLLILTKTQCQFAYRDSIFKGQLKDKGVIVEVRLKLAKQWQAIKTYAGLQELPENVSADDIYQKVIAIRSEKLPDPRILPNAGSFFKNPVVTDVIFKRLLKQYPNMPYYPQIDGSVKLAAGWLIEQAGFKGVHRNGAVVHDKQALVLVNLDSASGQAIHALAMEINQQVLTQFNVALTPEVRMVSQFGYVSNEAFHG